MHASAATPRITAADRLGLTLVFAVIIHAVIILEVSFTPEDDASVREAPPSMEITLVQQRANEKTPDTPDYLAQLSQEGGGNSPTKERPTSPAAAPMSVATPGETLAVAAPSSPQLETAQPDSQVLTSETAERQASTEDKASEAERKSPTAAQLIMRSMEFAQLQAEIDESQRAYAARPKHRFISAQTREFRDAAYLDAWQRKVEQIGNLNYPEEAKRRNLSGSLRLDVALNPDGTIHSITVRRSSGHKLLDDAAVRIVRLASPFAPFPEEMRADTDVLHIIRTWVFLPGNRVETR